MEVFRWKFGMTPHQTFFEEGIRPISQFECFYETLFGSHSTEGINVDATAFRVSLLHAGSIAPLIRSVKSAGLSRSITVCSPLQQVYRGDHPHVHLGHL